MQAEREIPGLGSPPQIQLDFVAEESEEEVPELVIEVHANTLPDTGFAVGQEGVDEAGSGSPPQAQVDVISLGDSTNTQPDAGLTIKSGWSREAIEGQQQQSA